MIETMTLVLLLTTMGPVEVGAAMVPYSLEDQHGESVSYSRDKRMVVISYEKATGKMVNKWLKEKPDSYLDSHGIDFIVEISGMPAIISNRIAIPKMRKYGHRVLICRDRDFDQTYPREAKKLTVILVQEGTVEDIVFVDEVAELERLAEGA